MPARVGKKVICAGVLGLLVILCCVQPAHGQFGFFGKSAKSAGAQAKPLPQDLVNEKLLVKRDKAQDSAPKVHLPRLLEASAEGEIDEVRKLLERDADPNLADENGRTALMKASERGHLEVVRMLLENGADTDIQDAGRQSAVLKASYWAHNEVVQMLLTAGANPDLQSEDGYSAIKWAAYYGNTAVVRMLLEHGADHSIKTINSLTALDIAERDPEESDEASKEKKKGVVELLRAHRSKSEL
jgi:ankyrin repeat protein